MRRGKGFSVRLVYVALRLSVVVWLSGTCWGLLFFSCCRSHTIVLFLCPSRRSLQRPCPCFTRVSDMNTHQSGVRVPFFAVHHTFSQFINTLQPERIALVIVLYYLLRIFLQAPPAVSQLLNGTRTFSRARS